jgi:polyphosphate kinase
LEHILSIYLEDNATSWMLTQTGEYVRSTNGDSGHNAQQYFLRELTTFKSLPAKLKTL